MYHYSLTRAFDDEENFSTTFTVSDRDPINCAHMLVAVFNTVNRNLMNGWLLGSVNTAGEGSVEFDGKIHRFAKPDPHTVSTSFKFEGSALGDSLITFFGENDATTYTVRGDVKLEEEPQLSVETVEIGPECFATTNGDVLCWRGRNYVPQGKYAPEVLESAYAELRDVKEQLANAGVETVPADSGVFDLRQQVRRSAEQIAELAQERANTEAEMNEVKRRNDFEHSARIAMEQQYAEENEAARAELITYLRGAAKKRQQLDPDGGREDLQARYSGMLDVLAKFLVATGEADADEGHAAARRLIAETED